MLAAVCEGLGRVVYGGDTHCSRCGNINDFRDPRQDFGLKAAGLCNIKGLLGAFTAWWWRASFISLLLYAHYAYMSSMSSSYSSNASYISGLDAKMLDSASRSSKSSMTAPNP